MKLPLFLKKYFWDAEFEKINFDDRKVYVLKRLLEYGNEESIKWMWKHFTVLDIKNILYRYRGLSLKSANFWSVIVDVKKEDVKCLKRRLSKEHETAWPY